MIQFWELVPVPELSLQTLILFQCSRSFSLTSSFAYPKHVGAEFYPLENLMLEEAFLCKPVITCPL